jgi:hypothetical protein
MRLHVLKPLFLSLIPVYLEIFDFVTPSTPKATLIVRGYVMFLSDIIERIGFAVLWGDVILVGGSIPEYSPTGFARRVFLITNPALHPLVLANFVIALVMYRLEVCLTVAIMRTAKGVHCWCRVDEWRGWTIAQWKPVPRI